MQHYRWVTIYMKELVSVYSHRPMHKLTRNTHTQNKTSLREMMICVLMAGDGRKILRTQLRGYIIVLHAFKIQFGMGLLGEGRWRRRKLPILREILVFFSKNKLHSCTHARACTVLAEY